MENMQKSYQKHQQKKLNALKEKYYTDNSGDTWYCKKCNAVIQGKKQVQSIHMKNTLMGFGETRNVTIPYCPNCEKKPSDTGFAHYGDDPFLDMY